MCINFYFWQTNNPKVKTQNKLVKITSICSIVISSVEGVGIGIPTATPTHSPSTVKAIKCLITTNLFPQCIRTSQSQEVNWRIHGWLSHIYTSSDTTGQTSWILFWGSCVMASLFFRKWFPGASTQLVFPLGYKIIHFL